MKSENRDYLASVYSNFGLNAALVGGHIGSGSPLNPTPRVVAVYGKFYLSQLSKADDPAELVIFASARSSTGDPGHFEVRPPNLTSRIWSPGPFSASSHATAKGFVDFRWDGKATVAMLCGNVELLDEPQLRDMWRWSHYAAGANERDFTNESVLRGTLYHADDARKPDAGAE